MWIWFAQTVTCYVLFWIGFLLIPFVIVKCFVEFLFCFNVGTKSLKGKTCLVTGAGGTLGRQLAIEFAREGCRVLCHDNDSYKLDKTIEAIHKEIGEENSNAQKLVYDVTDVMWRDFLRGEIKKLCNGEIDILVNNLNVSYSAPYSKMSLGHIEKTIETNVTCQMRLIREYLPSMIKRGEGHIIGISSIASSFGVGCMVPWSTSKWAIAGLMDSLYHEFRITKSPIKTLVVYPGFTASPFIPKDGKKNPGNVLQYYFKNSARSLAKEIVHATKTGKRSITTPFYYTFFSYMMNYVLPEFIRDYIAKQLFDLSEYAVSCHLPHVNEEVYHPPACVIS